MSTDPSADEDCSVLWRLDFREAIDWCEPLPDAGALLVVARDGQAQLIDARTGRPRWPQPAGLPRGVRFVGTHDGIAYVHDRFSVFALAAKPGADGDPLRWRAGDPPPLATRPAGDPEFVTRIVAAAAAKTGVLVVRSDGAVSLLTHADGRPLWRTRVDPLPAATLHVEQNSAALLGRSSGRVYAAFLDLSVPAAPRIEPVVLGESWPLWSGLPAGRLICVWPQRVLRVDAAGGRSDWPVPGGRRIVGRAIATTRAGDADARPVLWFGTDDGELWQMEVSLGEPARVTHPDEAAGRMSWLELRPAGRRLLARHGGGLWVCLPGATEPAATFAADSLHVRSAAAGAGGLTVLAAVRADEGELRLQHWRGQPGGQLGPPDESCRIAGISDQSAVVRVIWSDRTVILVTRSELIAIERP